MPRKSAPDNPTLVSTGAAAAAPARRQSSTPKRVTRSVKSTFTAVAEVAEPSQDEIAQLAYSYWVARGYEGGSPEADWLRAEQELRAAR